LKTRREAPLGIRWIRWEDLKEIGWEVVDWMHLAQDRNQWRTLVNTVMNFRISGLADRMLAC
jgi:hypothetical protein